MALAGGICAPLGTCSSCVFKIPWQGQPSAEVSCKVMDKRLVMLLSITISIHRLSYRKFPKYSDTQNICCNHSKI